jgi:ABC-2 type transport system permease protein
MSIQIVNYFFESRLWVLIIKESKHIFRDKQLWLLLIFLPIIQLLIFSFSLNPDVNNLRLGIIDYSNTFASRELIAAFTVNKVFIPELYTTSQPTLDEQIQQGRIDIGLVIPAKFNRDLQQGSTAQVQVFIDGVDANRAGVASNYITQIINQYSRQLAPTLTASLITPNVTFLYNPGLTSSWFFVVGVLGILLLVTSSLVSSAVVVREKDVGTLEQLLMTPAAAWEILMAKIIPLFIFLMGDVILALCVAHLIFNLPLRGNLLLFLLLSGFYILVGIGIGSLLATFSRNQLQAELISFFINVPLIQLSGAVTPIESMPTSLQYLSLLNPVRHYIMIVRGLLLKGVGLNVLWLNMLALGIFAMIFLTIGISRFRNQLS